MKAWVEPQKTSVSIIEYFFAAILILNCSTIWTSYEESPLTRILKILVVVVAILYLFMFFNSKVPLSSFRHVFGAAVIIACYAVVYIVVVRYGTVNFLTFLVDVLCIYFIIKLAQSNGRLIGILCKYENLILIIAVVSLIFWLFGSTLGIIHSTGNVYSTWTGDEKTIPTYFNLYFETQTTDSGFIRNSGIFTEAPMYNFNLCIALFIELFGRRKISKARCVILLITILTTISLTGWSVAIIALLAFYLSRKSFTRVAEFIKSLIIPVALIAALFIVYLLLEFRLDTGSGMVRIDDFKAGFEAWKTHIWFGCGFGNMEYIQTFMSDFRSYNLGFSNSPTQILAQGGVLLAIPYLWFAYKWIQSSVVERNLSRILFFLCFVFLFTFTVTSYRFLVVFLFMSYSAIGQSCPVQETAPMLIFQRKKILAGKYRIRLRAFGARYNKNMAHIKGKER